MIDEASEAAVLWGGRDLRMIRNRENAVFEMTLPQGRAALRLHRQGYQGAAAIKSELWWCATLAAKGVAVPAPLPSIRGALLEQLSTGRNASAIAWVDGEPLGDAGVPFSGDMATVIAQHRALGKLLAEVHSATDGLVLPADFVRPSWDVDGLTGEQPFWGRFWEHPALRDDEAKAMRHARDYLRERLTGFQAAGGDFGLIHADVLRENILVNGRSVSLIDFDDSGLGFRQYDLGTAMLHNLYEPQRDALQDALIEGYSAARALVPNMVPLFTLARTLASVGWVAPRLPADDPVHRSHIARALMWAEHVISSENKH